MHIYAIIIIIIIIILEYILYYIHHLNGCSHFIASPCAQSEMPINVCLGTFYRPCHPCNENIDLCLISSYHSFTVPHIIIMMIVICILSLLLLTWQFVSNINIHTDIRFILVDQQHTTLVHCVYTACWTQNICTHPLNDYDKYLARN